jgi:signal peptidase I
MVNMKRQKVSRRFHVEDWSMAPTFLPGERIKVDTEVYKHRDPLPGEVIVMLDPEVEGRKLLKRVKEVKRTDKGTAVFVVGDNELRSRDSRHFGMVGMELVVGLVNGGDRSAEGPESQAPS